MLGSGADGFVSFGFDNPVNPDWIDYLFERSTNGHDEFIDFAGENIGGVIDGCFVLRSHRLIYLTVRGVWIFADDTFANGYEIVCVALQQKIPVDLIDSSAAGFFLKLLALLIADLFMESEKTVRHGGEKDSPCGGQEKVE